MPRTLTWPVPFLIATVLVLLLTACSSAPVRSPQLAPAVPPLPAQARQPNPPEICSPTCSDGLTKLRGTLLRTQTAQ